MTLQNKKEFAESQLKTAQNRLNFNSHINSIEKFDVEKAIEKTEKALNELLAIQNELEGEASE